MSSRQPACERARLEHIVCGVRFRGRHVFDMGKRSSSGNLFICVACSTHTHARARSHAHFYLIQWAQGNIYLGGKKNALCPLLSRMPPEQRRRRQRRRWRRRQQRRRHAAVLSLSTCSHAFGRNPQETHFLAYCVYATAAARATVYRCDAVHTHRHAHAHRIILSLTPRRQLGARSSHARTRISRRMCVRV